MTTGADDDDQLSLDEMLIELENMLTESVDDEELRLLASGLAQIGKLKYALHVNGASDAAMAFVESYARCLWGLVLDTDPPIPVKRAVEVAFTTFTLSRDVMYETMAAVALSWAMDEDFDRTGQVPIDPSPQARLAAAEWFEKITAPIWSDDTGAAE